MFFVTLLLTVSIGCGDRANPGPNLEFKVGENYVSQDMPFPVGGTFKVGLTATHGKMIQNLTISVSVNGGADEVQTCGMCDSLINSTSLDVDFNGVTGNQAGTEKWSFSLSDANGNITTKTITFTLVSGGMELYPYEKDNNSPPQPFRLWNSQGPNSNLSAYQMGSGYLGLNDPGEWKDIVDSVKAQDGANWPGRWGSQNGSTFKKVEGFGWATVKDTKQLEAMWQNAGTAQNTINPAKGDYYLIKTPSYYGFIEITDVVNTASDELDYTQFRYKFRP